MLDNLINFHLGTVAILLLPKWLYTSGRRSILTATSITVFTEQSKLQEEALRRYTFLLT